MPQVTQKQALRRYMTFFMPLMMLYLVGLLGSVMLLKHYTDPPLWMPIAGTAAATLPLFGVLYVWLRYAREADEYQQHRMLWGFAISGCLTAGLAFLLGFAQNFELIEHMPDYWYGIIFISLQGIVVALGGGKCLP